jgi:hypothetical protein
MRGTGSLAITLAVGVLVSACATVEGPSPAQRGRSGPVAWEVVDLRREAIPEGGTRWYYTIVLKELAGRAIQFEKVQRQWEAEPGNSTLREEAFRRRLNAASELTLRGSQGVVPGTGGNTFGPIKSSVRVLFRFLGRDEAGQEVQVDVPLSFGSP